MSNPTADPRCKCGEVPIPNGWGGTVTRHGHIHKYHYFDRCAEMVVYDEVAPSGSDHQPTGDIGG